MLHSKQKYIQLKKHVFFKCRCQSAFTYMSTIMYAVLIYSIIILTFVCRLSRLSNLAMLDVDIYNNNICLSL